MPVPPLFGEFAHLAPTEVVSGGTPSAKSTPVKASISLLAASAVEAKVAGCVSDILGKEVATNKPDDAGLDLGAVELRDAVTPLSTWSCQAPWCLTTLRPARCRDSSSAEHPGRGGDRNCRPTVAVRSSRQRETLGVVGSSSRTSRDALRADSALDAIARPPRAVVPRRLGRYCACPGALWELCR